MPATRTPTQQRPPGGAVPRALGAALVAAVLAAAAGCVSLAPQSQQAATGPGATNQHAAVAIAASQPSLAADAAVGVSVQAPHAANVGGDNVGRQTIVNLSGGNLAGLLVLTALVGAVLYPVAIRPVRRRIFPEGKPVLSVLQCPMCKARFAAVDHGHPRPMCPVCRVNLERRAGPGDASP